MNEPAVPYLLTNQNSPAYWLSDNLWMPLAGSVLTDGNFCFIEQVCGLGVGGPCTHAHPMDEGLYVLEGHCTFQAGGSTIDAGAGTFVCVPRFVEHSFAVDVPNTRLLNFYTPGGFEMLLSSLAIPAPERKPPIPNTQPMPPRWMVEECSREFGQISVGGLPFADPPSAENMVTKPSNVTSLKPYAMDVKKAPSYWSQGVLWTILATEEQTGGAYSLMEELCSLHAGPAPHTHEQDEIIYLLEGELTLIAGSLKVTAKAGSLAYIPRHCVHSFRVDIDKTRLLNFYLPGGFEKVLTELGVPATSHTLPPADTQQRGTPEQAEALFQKVGTSSVAFPDSLRS